MKFIIEQSAYSGVLKIAGKVAHDMELVTGTLPEIRVVETIDHEEVRSSAAREPTIIVATMGHSRWLDAQKSIPTDVLKGKRECYGWFFPDDIRTVSFVGDLWCIPVCELVSCGAGASG